MQVLQDNCETITAELGAAGTAVPAAAETAAASAVPAAAAPSNATAATASVSGAEAAAGAEKSGTGDTIYRLGSASSKKFAGVSEFKGKRMISIREHYQKGGEGPWLPGSKGISLAAEQFETLCSNAEVQPEPCGHLDGSTWLRRTAATVVAAHVLSELWFSSCHCSSCCMCSWCKRAVSPI